MAYDITRDQVVLFGGSDYSVPKGDTWEFGPNFNLVLSFKKVKPRSAAIGDKLKMIVIVRNTGTEKSPPSNAYFYLSANTTLDQNDIILGSKPVKGLKPNKSKRVRLKVTVPASVTPGTYYVIVEVVPAAVNSRGIVAVYGRTITIN